MTKLKTAIWVLLPLFTLSACTGDNPYKAHMHEAPADQAQIDENTIIQHLVDNDVNDALRTESGIYYTISRKGNGKHPTDTDIVQVHYKGTLLDGTSFDSSYDRGEPAEFALNAVIKGWTEGLQLMDVGSEATFYIPSGLAYGANPRPGGVIKPNDPLVFKVELLDIVDKTAYNKNMTDKYRQYLEPQIAPGREKYGEKDERAILDYIKKNNLKAEKNADGIYYVIDEEGNGEHPSLMNQVTVHYTGTLLNGKEFDSSKKGPGEPITFPLTRVVPGWTFGIPVFSKGGKGKLLIPSYLGYGERGSGEDIPANSPLVFEVELIDFK